MNKFKSTAHIPRNQLEFPHYWWLYEEDAFRMLQWPIELPLLAHFPNSPPVRAQTPLFQFPFRIVGEVIVDLLLRIHMQKCIRCALDLYRQILSDCIQYELLVVVMYGTFSFYSLYNKIVEKKFSMKWTGLGFLWLFWEKNPTPTGEWFDCPSVYRLTLSTLYLESQWSDHG